MKITEQQLTDVTIGIKCDICNKTQSPHQTFATIKYHGGGWMGCMDYQGELEICSCKCFIAALKRLKINWENIDSVSDCCILQQTVNDVEGGI